MTDDIETRAERVHQIAKSVGGSVLDRTDNIVRVEIPADMATNLMTSWGMGGFRPVPLSNEIFRQIPARIFRDGVMIETDGTQSMKFYLYDIDLNPPQAPASAPTPADITRPTPPFKG